jgi:hypothetical protein
VLRATVDEEFGGREGRGTETGRGLDVLVASVKGVGVVRVTTHQWVDNGSRHTEADERQGQL